MVYVVLIGLLLSLSLGVNDRGEIFSNGRTKRFKFRRFGDETVILFGWIKKPVVSLRSRVRSRMPMKG